MFCGPVRFSGLSEATHQVWGETIMKHFKAFRAQSSLGTLKKIRWAKSIHATIQMKFLNVKCCLKSSCRAKYSSDAPPTFMQGYQWLQGTKDLVQLMLSHDWQLQHRVMVGLHDTHIHKCTQKMQVLQRKCGRKVCSFGGNKGFCLPSSPAWDPPPSLARPEPTQRWPGGRQRVWE